MNKEEETADTNKNAKTKFCWKGMVKKGVRKTENYCNTGCAYDRVGGGRTNSIFYYECTEL